MQSIFDVFFDQVFFSSPCKIVDMQCRFLEEERRGNSGSKERKRGHRVVVERQHWARRPQGLDLSH